MALSRRRAGTSKVMRAAVCSIAYSNLNPDFHGKFFSIAGAPAA
jgi:hypothetical protein